MSAVLPGAPSATNTSATNASATNPSDKGAARRPIVEPPVLNAADRLAASRARLRAALMDIAHPPPKPSMLDDLGLGGFGNDLLSKLKGLPGADFVLGTLQHWWADHPLHTAGKLAEEASRRFVGPIARSNPVAAVAGAVVLGAVLAFAKPWKWLIRPALFVGLVPQLASQALKHLPVESWLGMLSTLATKRPAAKKKPTTTPVHAAPPASGLPKDS